MAASGPIIESKFNWKMQGTSFLHRVSTAISTSTMSVVILQEEKLS